MYTVIERDTLGRIHSVVNCRYSQDVDAYVAKEFGQVMIDGRENRIPGDNVRLDRRYYWGETIIDVWKPLNV